MLWNGSCVINTRSEQHERLWKSEKLQRRERKIREFRLTKMSSWTNSWFDFEITQIQKDRVFPAGELEKDEIEHQTLSLFQWTWIFNSESTIRCWPWQFQVIVLLVQSHVYAERYIASQMPWMSQTRPKCVNQYIHRVVNDENWFPHTSEVCVSYQPFRMASSDWSAKWQVQFHRFLRSYDKPILKLDFITYSLFVWLSSWKHLSLRY
jgi:hypothetical protein